MPTEVTLKAHREKSRAISRTAEDKIPSGVRAAWPELAAPILWTKALSKAGALSSVNDEKALKNHNDGWLWPTVSRKGLTPARNQDQDAEGTGDPGKSWGIPETRFRVENGIIEVASPSE
ncbi:uncharacterized protein EMH_0026060 [Eimeria mitis]|uniref:Uncharacterized protein n=1 Tax=Eimeria mitis TaxID=44415 RepID=U6KBY3_9EIME|nr:uncharacterized protein EMH_0026060 [Eimeria mitis]CDJ35439.1 hypothetical protein EMH_0026060 [Eimeria mitis]